MIRDTKRSIFHTVAMLGTFALGFWALPAAAQLAPWQQPPNSALSNSPHTNALPEGDGTAAAANPDPFDQTPTSWANEEWEQECNVLGYRPGVLPNLFCESVHNRFWFRSEFLAWWAKGFATPPLLTTSTDPADAGILGSATTSVLLGGKDLSGGFLPGERLTFGAWLDCCQTWGVESSYLQLNRQTAMFNANGVSVPVLARPIFNLETGQQDSEIIASPGQQSGTFSSEVATQFQIVEVLVRRNLNQRPGFTLDMVAGYRYQQLNDHLEVGDSLTFSGSQSAFPAGSMVQQTDRFDARNSFQGGVVGMAAALHRQCWSLDGVLKIGIGQTHSHIDIEGATSETIPGQGTSFLPGGLLALPSNIGVHDSNQFSLVPELGLTLGYDLAPQLRVTLGYDVVYWNAVARPGDQIDLNIDPRQLPPSAVTNATHPQFILHTSDYWAQGLNLGLDLRF